MYPHTAMALKERKGNSLKDFVSIAGVYGVTHMIIITETEKGCYLKLVKNPSGPTLTFKIENYSLQGDVVHYQQSIRPKHFRSYQKEIAGSPLLVMNGFSQVSADAQDAFKYVTLMW